MTRRPLLSLLCVFAAVVCASLCANEPTAIVEAPYQPDYAKGLPEKHLWREVRENFLKNVYPKILARHQLKLSCGSCTTVYADFELNISLAGTVKIRNVTVAKACGQPMNKKLKADFSRYLEHYPYKPGLYGTTVLLRLGTGLKC
jgi:hypothetical protein